MVNVLKQNNLKLGVGRLKISPYTHFNVGFFFHVFKCYKGADQTWMSLNYTLFLHLVKSKMKHGGGRGEDVMTIVCCVSVWLCVCLFSVGSNSIFFFLRVGSTLGGVCSKGVHQGKEFNKSCRKRSGSGISERRPGKQVQSITNLGLVQADSASRR